MHEQPTTISEDQTTEPAFDSIRAEISREMVRLYKELFGRGPTKARTEFAGSDIVICTLENTFDLCTEVFYLDNGERRVS